MAERWTMSLFAQATKLSATAGNVDVLLAKFKDAAEIQKDNAACEVMIAGKSSIESDVVYLFEVWSSKEEWEAARSSPAIARWARDMPPLVSAAPESIRLDSATGKGLSRPS
jgi:quinol monooxygenase YgiN